MPYRPLAVVLATAILTLAASASPARAQAGGHDAFAPMSFMAGHCWRGTFRDRPTVTDEHCFEWVYGGRFLRDRHVVRGDSVPYEGETLFAWDRQENRIVYWYIALPGFHSTGHLEHRDDRLTFLDNVRLSEGSRDLRSVWVRTGPESYTVRTEDHTGGVVRELWSMEMRRVSSIDRRR